MPARLQITIGVDPGKNGGIFFIANRYFFSGGPENGFKATNALPMPLIVPKAIKTLKKDAKGKRIKKQPKTKPDYDSLAHLFALAMEPVWESGARVEACIERVAARPGQGGVSMFNFGMVYGFAYGMIRAHGIPVTFVNPAVWKEAVGLPVGADGKASRDLAASLFPQEDFSMAKHEGVAEASLIAHYHNITAL